MPRKIRPPSIGRAGIRLARNRIQFRYPNQPIHQTSIAADAGSPEARYGAPVPWMLPNGLKTIVAPAKFRLMAEIRARARLVIGPARATQMASVVREAYECDGPTRLPRGQSRISSRS